MDDNKELVKKDLSLVLRINAKVNYGNKSEVKQIYGWILQKKLFRTSLGTAYAKRLEQIVNGTEQRRTCVLCANDMDNRTVICKSCLEKYRKFQQPKENVAKETEAKGKEGQEPKDVKKDIDSQQQVSDISKQAATAIKGGLDTFTSKISGMAGESDVARQLKEKSKKISEQIHTDIGKAKDGSERPSDGQPGKSGKGKWIAAGIAIVAVCFILRAIGLGRIFMFLALAAIGWVVYKFIKKEKKRNAVIAAAVLLVLAGVFSGGGAGNGNDLSNLLGKTQKQAEKQYGKPDSTGDIGIDIYVYDNEDWYYGVAKNGKIVNVELSGGDKALMGISIGDTQEDVERIMKKKGAKQQESLVTSDRMNQFSVKGYGIDIYYDSGFRVEKVDVYAGIK